MKQPDIVMEMPSGTQFAIRFEDDGVFVESPSKSMAESFKTAAEDLRGQVSPADGNPYRATANLLAERFGAKVISVIALKRPVLPDGQEVVY